MTSIRPSGYRETQPFIDLDRDGTGECDGQEAIHWERLCHHFQEATA